MMRFTAECPSCKPIEHNHCSHVRTPKNAPKPPKDPPPRHLKEAGAVEWGSSRNKDWVLKTESFNCKEAERLALAETWEDEEAPAHNSSLDLRSISSLWNVNCLQEDFVEEDETDQWNGWQAVSQIIFKSPAIILVMFALGLSVKHRTGHGKKKGRGIKTGSGRKLPALLGGRTLSMYASAGFLTWPPVSEVSHVSLWAWLYSKLILKRETSYFRIIRWLSPFGVVAMWGGFWRLGGEDVEAWKKSQSRETQGQAKEIRPQKTREKQCVFKTKRKWFCRIRSQHFLLNKCEVQDVFVRGNQINEYIHNVNVKHFWILLFSTKFNSRKKISCKISREFKNPQISRRIFKCHCASLRAKVLRRARPLEWKRLGTIKTGGLRQGQSRYNSCIYRHSAYSWYDADWLIYRWQEHRNLDLLSESRRQAWSYWVKQDLRLHVTGYQWYGAICQIPNVNLTFFSVWTEDGNIASWTSLDDPSLVSCRAWAKTWILLRGM